MKAVTNISFYTESLPEFEALLKRMDRIDDFKDEIHYLIVNNDEILISSPDKNRYAVERKAIEAVDDNFGTLYKAYKTNHAEHYRYVRTIVGALKLAQMGSINHELYCIDITFEFDADKYFPVFDENLKLFLDKQEADLRRLQECLAQLIKDLKKKITENKERANTAAEETKTEGVGPTSAWTKLFGGK